MEKTNKALSLENGSLFDQISAAFNGPVRGESRLLAAILESAILDASAPGSNECSKAKTWIQAQNNDVVSFVGICEHFGIDPIDARKKILQGVSIQ